MNENSFTIIIPTHQRYQKLVNLLTSISEVRNPHINSVIVVDDSPHKIVIENQFKELCLKQIMLDSRVFISKAKNIGWREADSKFVYFMDDDNVVSMLTFSAIFDFISGNEHVGAVMPAVLYKARPELVWVYATPFTAGKWSHELIGRNKPRNPLIERNIIHTDALPNASIMRLEALESVGGFNENLSVNSSSDLCVRLNEAGWDTFSFTSSFIFHDVSTPADTGSWTEHSISDPDRLFFEIHDWFMLMKQLHIDQPFFCSRATLHSLKFIIPNSLTYVLKGGNNRKSLLLNTMKGYLSGMRDVRNF